MRKVKICKIDQRLNKLPEAPEPLKARYYDTIVFSVTLVTDKTEAVTMQVVVTKNTLHMQPAPGFTHLPDFNEEEMQYISSHLRCFFDLLFPEKDSAVLWLPNRTGGTK
ncbi:MAG TPA: hypothetical protein VI911_02400 [Patescibacteria group bacterium]|nr:hypothetical protein [Patescibacteria group bacterium]